MLFRSVDPGPERLCNRFGHAPSRTIPGAPPAPPRARPSPSPHRSEPTDPSLPVRKAQPLPAKHRLSRFRWSPGRFWRLFKPISLTTHLIPAVVEINHAAWRRLLRPFPSATPLHPSVYEKKERSKGRRSVVVGKERSRGGEARWWVVENRGDEERVGAQEARSSARASSSPAIGDAPSQAAS